MAKAVLGTNYTIEEDSNGDLVIKDGTNGDVLKYDRSADELSAEKPFTTESLGIKGKPWFDVIEYGAVGDGSTDDSTAIQNAINDAEAASDIGVVFFPKPDTDYRIGDSLIASQQVALIGPEPYSSAIKRADGMGSAMLKNDIGGGVPAQDVYVWGLDFDGSDEFTTASYGPSLKAIGFKPHTTDDESRNVFVEKCHVHDTRATGIGIDSIPNLHVRENIVERSGTDGETTGSNGIGIGLGERSDACPMWVENNRIVDTAEFGIVLEQTGDTNRSWGHHINGNTVNDARVGIGVEYSLGVEIRSNTIIYSTRMDRCIYGDSLDGTKGVDRVVATGNVMTQGVGSAATPDTNAVEWGTDAAWCIAHGNIVHLDVDTAFVNNGSFCAVRGVGQEAAGFGSTPTAGSRWQYLGVTTVKNTDDGALWTLDADDSWNQKSAADASNLTGKSASVAGFQAYDDGTNTTGSGALCTWDNSNNQWLPADGSAAFS